MIAPLSAEVEADVAGLDRRLAEIARRYVRRLPLEPSLGSLVKCGALTQRI